SARARAATVREPRRAGIAADRLRATDDASIGDLGGLLTRIEEQLANGGVDDRAALFRLAAEACHAGQVRWAALPVVLLDVPLDSRTEQEFAAALASRSPAVLATVPEDDAAALETVRSMGATIAYGDDDAVAGSDLANLRRFVFRSEPPPVRTRAGDVTLFSAPGEGREAVEIVRRVLDEA